MQRRLREARTEAGKLDRNDKPIGTHYFYYSSQANLHLLKIDNDIDKALSPARPNSAAE